MHHAGAWVAVAIGAGVAIVMSLWAAFRNKSDTDA